MHVVMSPRSIDSAEGLLRGVDDVEKSVLVAFARVQVGHRRRDRGQRRLVHQKEEGLIRVELKPPSDDVDELADGHVVGDEELALVEDGKRLLARVTLDDHGDLVRVRGANLLDVLYSKR